jgi:DNA mismatch repair protein MSH4
MSGKSTYIRSVALLAVMVQIGSLYASVRDETLPSRMLKSYSVPAKYASFPIFSQLFARVNLDDCVEANVSTFTAEMRDMAFILRNIDNKSLCVLCLTLSYGTDFRVEW